MATKMEAEGRQGPGRKRGGSLATGNAVVETIHEGLKSQKAAGGEETEKERLLREKEERRMAWEAANSGKKPEKKKLTKAERRELQNAQKEAKTALHKQGTKTTQNSSSQSSLQQQNNRQKQIPKSSIQTSKSTEYVSSKGDRFAGVGLFSHIKPRRTPEFVDYEGIHPAILSLGLQSTSGKMMGASDRVESMLYALKEMIHDYKLPEGQAISRDLDRQIKKMVQFLTTCLPHSIPMGNAIKQIRAVVSKMRPEMTEAEAKAELLQMIDTYICNSIKMAREEVVKQALGVIQQDDTILTFGHSRVIESMIFAAHERKLRFKVVVVSCRPYHEGQALTKSLAAAGVDCVFGQLSSLSYLIKSVNKILFGAISLFSNGSALGRAGTALIAMTAHYLKKPVLVCVETHKFTDRIQLNSFVYNELGDPDALTSCPNGVSASETFLSDWRHEENLHLLNVMYDLTPPEFITAVITEFGVLPASSVPVIVREKEASASA